MPFSVRSLFSKLSEELEERNRDWAIREQAKALRQWSRFGSGTPLQFGLPSAGDLNPLGIAYERDRLEDKSLRPRSWFRGLVERTRELSERAEEERRREEERQERERQRQAFEQFDPVEELRRQQEVQQLTQEAISGVLPGGPQLDIFGAREAGFISPADVQGLAFQGIRPDQPSGIPAGLPETLREAEFGNIQGVGAFGSPLPGALLDQILPPELLAPVRDVPFIGEPLHRQLSGLNTPLGAAVSGRFPAQAILGIGGATAAGAIGEAADLPFPAQIGAEIGGDILAGGFGPGLLRRGARNLIGPPPVAQRPPIIERPPIRAADDVVPPSRIEVPPVERGAAGQITELESIQIPDSIVARAEVSAESGRTVVKFEVSGIAVEAERFPTLDSIFFDIKELPGNISSVSGIRQVGVAVSDIANANPGQRIIATVANDKLSNILRMLGGIPNPNNPRVLDVTDVARSGFRRTVERGAVAAPEGGPSRVLKEAAPAPPARALAEPLDEATAVAERELTELGVPPIQGADPVTRLTELIRTAKPAVRGTQELVRAEKGRRSAEAFKELGKAKTGEEASRGVLRSFKGELPTAAFDPPRGSLTPIEIDDLKVRVRDFYVDKPKSQFDAAATFGAVDSILDGNIPNKSQLILLEKVFGEELVRAFDTRSLARLAFDEGAAALSLWRTFITGGEQSLAFRQAAILGLNPFNLPTTARAITRSLKAGLSDKAAVKIMAEFEARPEFTRLSDAADRAGYRLFTKFSGFADPLVREENFTALERTMVGRIANKTPILGQYLRFSQRNAVVLLNSFRLDIGAKYLKAVDNAAAKGVASAADEEAVARAMAVLTGRGKLPKNEVVQLLSRALFTAQLQAATIQTPFLLLERSPVVRKLVAKEIASFIGFGLSLLAAAKLSGAVDVELDWRSTDFGKIKIGPTRISTWGAFQAYVKLIAQLTTGKRKTSMGDIQKLSRDEAFTRFWTNKMSPPLTLAGDIRRGESAIGEPVDFTTTEGFRKELFNRFLPLITQDVVDAIREQDSYIGAAIAPLVWFGIGVQSYTTPSVRTAHLIGEALLRDQLPDGDQYTTIPLRLRDLTPADREAFLELHPEIEEALARRGEGGAGEIREGLVAEFREEQGRDDERLASYFTSGGTTGIKPPDWKDNLKKRQADLFSRRDQVLQDFKVEFADREPSGPVNEAIEAYFDVDIDRFTEDATGEVNWEAYFAAKDRALAGLDSQTREEVLDFIKRNFETPAVTAVRKLAGGLDEYYGFDVEGRTGRVGRRKRDILRFRDKTVDATLFIVGNTTCVKTTSARKRVGELLKSDFDTTVSTGDLRRAVPICR